MATRRYVKGRDGKFAGSIGAGKSEVPTAQATPEHSRESDPESRNSTVADAYAKFGHHTETGGDDEAQENAQVHYHLIVSGSRDTRPEDEVEAFLQVAKDLRPPQQSRLVKLLSLAGKFELARREELPSEVYATLAETVSPRILDNLGANPSCPTNVFYSYLSTPSLYTYISKEFPDVNSRLLHRCVVDNSNLQSTSLRRLSGSAVDVRCAVASHANTDSETLRRLAHDRSSRVVAKVAANPRTTGDVLHDIATRHGHGSDLRVVRRVLENPNTTRETLRHIAGWQRSWVGDEAQRRLDEPSLLRQLPSNQTQPALVSDEAKLTNRQGEQ